VAVGGLMVGLQVVSGFNQVIGFVADVIRVIRDVI